MKPSAHRLPQEHITVTEQMPNRLRELRETREWHVSKVAAVFNISEKVVYRWENGDTPVPSDNLPALARLFEVSVEHLMGWDRDDTRAAA